MTKHKKPTKHKSTHSKHTSKKQSIKKHRLIKSANASENSQLPSSLSFSDFVPPDGFRTVPIPHALVEYATPLMEMVPDPEDIVKAAEVFEIATSIWYYTLNDIFEEKDKISKTDVLDLIHKEIGLDQAEADDFFSMMVERKHYLLPNNIQPEGSVFQFIRKEVCYLIDRFDYEELKISPEIIPPNTIDLKVMKNLEKLDHYILKSTNYTKYEELSLNVWEECLDRFNIWLTNKGVTEHQDIFVDLADGYISFLYDYLHEETVTLKSEPSEYLVEFLLEFLLLKTDMIPWEYTLSPAAIKLFYEFLYEKGYLVEPPDTMIQFIDLLEPYYIDILKKRFS
jgi:hypothetical protein